MSLVFHYLLNDNTANTTIADASGVGNNAVAARNTNLTYYANGKVGAAWYGNGTTDRITCATDLAGAGALTMCCWLYLDSFSAHGYPRLAWSNKSNDGKLLWDVYTAAGARTLRFSSDSVTVIYAAANCVNTAAWYHLAVTRAANATVTFYVNGAVSGTANQTSGTPPAGTTQLIIGNRSAGDRGIDGRLDDFRLYNTVLTLGQIRAIRNNDAGTANGTPWLLGPGHHTKRNLHGGMVRMAG